jgi:hypothetical protein
MMDIPHAYEDPDDELDVQTSFALNLLTEPLLVTFLDKFLAGVLNPTVTSEELLPQEATSLTSRPLHKVVASNFNTLSVPSLLPLLPSVCPSPSSPLSSLSSPLSSSSLTLLPSVLPHPSSPLSSSASVVKSAEHFLLFVVAPWSGLPLPPLPPSLISAGADTANRWSRPSAHSANSSIASPWTLLPFHPPTVTPPLFSPEGSLLGRWTARRMTSPFRGS